MTSPIHHARPFLKWAGGKTQLLGELIARVPAEFRTYHEPFVGGGALFFELLRRGRIVDAYLSDINMDLIDVYTALRDQVEQVISALKSHRYDRYYFYKVRAMIPESLPLPERAARTIYLNRTCFNGLYRENRAGQFNVPFGRYTNPTICDEANLRAVSHALQGVNISCHGFETVLDTAKPGDFVYFDPPYHPVSTTSSFTAYDRSGFGLEEQYRLRDVYEELTSRGVKAMLSNSDTSLVRQLYREHRIARVLAKRAINSKASARGRIGELIICNYEITEVVQPVLLEKQAKYGQFNAHDERNIAAPS
ncbi:MAG: DNA adenine methylase [Anaerolineae bacterium]